MPFRIIIRLTLVALLGCVTAIPTPAKSEKWTDPEGREFKGEPAAIIGPVAVFETGAITSRRVPLGSLSDADCVRFHSALATLPPRANPWQAATSSVSKDFIGGLYLLENKDLVRLNLATRPEPEFFILLFCSNNEGASWGAANAVQSAYPELKKKHGDLIETIFLGRGHDANQHRSMTSQLNVPWPIADLHGQRQMTHVMEFAPAKAPLVAVVTRNGTLLQAVSSQKYEDYARLMADFGRLLAVSDRDAPAGWADRLHYARAVQPVAHKNDSCGPEMLGHPLSLDALRKHGITRIEAQIAVAADGKVTGVKVGTNAVITPEFAAVIEPAIAKSPFVPAVDHGTFVDGTYAFVLEIAP